MKKPLAVLSDERSANAMPNVPTIREGGVENFEVITWYGLLAPAGTQRDTHQPFERRMDQDRLAMPDTREKMKNAEVDPMSSTPEQFAEFIKAETARLGQGHQAKPTPGID